MRCEANSWLNRSTMPKGKTHNGGNAQLVSREKAGHSKTIMKRHGNLFKEIVEPANIYKAYTKARKGKRWQDTVKRFERNIDHNIEAIHNTLTDQTFTTSPYTQRTIYEPKERIIYKLPFNQDRIVQHSLMNILEPIWDPLFIHDSYSCRIGKGIHAGSRRTMEFIRKVGKYGYCLKMDVRKFYPSINHDLMYDIVKHKIKCKDTLWLLRDIIYSFGGGYNIPIGNYTSQWLGNLYLNELDQHLKHEYHVKNYIRYCDDVIVLHEDKQHLHEIADTSTEFLSDNLDMQWGKCDVFPISQGTDFLGYRHFPEKILLRKSTAKRVRQRLKLLPSLLAKKEITQDQYISSIASTMGWLKWANAYNFSEWLGIEQMWGELHVAG